MRGLKIISSSLDLKCKIRTNFNIIWRLMGINEVQFGLLMNGNGLSYNFLVLCQFVLLFFMV